MSPLEHHLNTTVYLVAFIAQSTLLLLSGLLASRYFKWNAAVRHTVLLATLLAVLVLPLVVLVCHQARLSVFPWFSTFVQVNAEPDEPVWEPTLDSMAAGGPLEFNVGTEAAAPDQLAAATGTTSPVGQQLAAVVGFIWLGGVGLLSMRYVLSHIRLAAIRKGARSAREPTLEDLRAAIATSLDMRHAPPLALSACVGGPAAVGLFRPVVLLPPRLPEVLSTEQLKDVLVHEFAHIKRGDHLVCLAERLVSTLLWPHPLVHVLRRKLSEAREEVCDNYVLRLGEGVRYGRTLLRVGESLSPALSLGLLTSGWKLEHRISNLLSERRKTMTHSSLTLRCVAGVTALACTFLISLGTPLDAQQEASDNVLTGATDAEVLAISDDGEVTVKHQDGYVTLTSDEEVLLVGEANEGPRRELSPGDQKEVDRLKQDYQQLQKKQKAIQNDLRQIEKKLQKLGVSIQRRTTRIIQRRATGTPGVSVVTPEVGRVRVSGGKVASRNAPLDVALDLAKPEVSRNLTLAIPDFSRSDDDRSKVVEDRLKRLEALMEKLLESRQSSPNDNNDDGRPVTIH